jgi:hypothetical protein
MQTCDDDAGPAERSLSVSLDATYPLLFVRPAGQTHVQKYMKTVLDMVLDGKIDTMAAASAAQRPR